ncbi:seipin [Phlebotomus argentipes]|uniref:seipin n=1 Tax=Phlebotomus argentipes TaxID=94469 RepID=UPI0028933FE8|nr:seipin [Phlebotomus argentipes]
MGLYRMLLNLVDPFGVIRNFIVKPANDFAFSLFLHYKHRTAEGVNNVRELLLKALIVFFAGAVVIWTAVFMYITFYYTYMPAIAHMRPVHMQFETCNVQGPCSYPSAHVSLTKKQQLLMVGQPYKVLVNIDMPESPQNQDVGMFMVCAEMRDQSTSLRGHSCRSAMLRYKSPLLNSLITWVMSPLLILGLREQKQIIPVELFSDYLDEKTYPVTDIYVEIQNKAVQFYEVNLQITAQLSGLRFFMFHWPILSATVGISTNLFIILLILLLSWYHWSDTTWIDEARDKYRNIKMFTPLSESPKHEEVSTTSVEKDSFVDDEDVSIIEDVSGFDEESESPSEGK